MSKPFKEEHPLGELRSRKKERASMDGAREDVKWEQEFQRGNPLLESCHGHALSRPSGWGFFR